MTGVNQLESTYYRFDTWTGGGTKKNKTTGREQSESDISVETEMFINSII